jgi:choline/glycine/proline betaine transport protein
MSSMLERTKGHIHPVVFPVSAAVILIFVLYGVLFTENAETVLTEVRVWITSNFGWFFITGITFFLLFCLWLVLGRYAKVKLGPDDASPDYSYLTWFAMLFSAGMGIGLVFWGVAEPMWHFGLWPPPGQEPVTAEAAQTAMIITYHHWGLGAWGIYAVLGLSLAYFGYRHNLPMTVRSALYPLIGDRMQGWAGNLVDVLAIFGTIFGIATSLGLGVLQINAGLNQIFGFAVTPVNQVILIAIITAVATISVVTGIDKGIRRLSELNITLAGLLLLFVALAGPTLLLLTAYVDNLGGYVTNFVDVLFWSGAYEGADFLDAWTIFYWAWWVSWAPFVGTFIARISRGRTIREFVGGVLVVPTLVSFLWFTVMGNTAINLEMQEGGGAILEATEAGSEQAMFALLQQLPLTTLTSIVTVIVVTIFFVTSSDSGSFVVDMIASGGDLNPPVGMRVFWAVTEGVVAAVLLLAGGLAALQAGAIATGLPFTAVLIIAAVGIFKGLRSEHPDMRIEDVPTMGLFESVDQVVARRAETVTGGPDQLRPRPGGDPSGPGDTPGGEGS